MNERTAAIVGAGLMGREIALVFAIAGFRTHMLDRETAVLEQAVADQAKRLAKKVQRGHLSAAEAASAEKRIIPTTSFEALIHSEVAVEAVFERLEVKAGVFAALDRTLPDSCLIASNTSSLPISRLAATLPAARRGRFIGMHFSSPASEMALCEIIPGLETAPETLKAAVSLARLLGKSPTYSRDVPGFVINRLLFAMLAEAQRLVDEGVATPDDIDAACRLGLNHPVGPFKIMDHIGNDLTRQIQTVLFEAYGPRFGLSNALQSLTDAGWLGKGSAKGWRDYPVGPVLNETSAGKQLKP